jgi:hypothetical protein
MKKFNLYASMESHEWNLTRMGFDSETLEEAKKEAEEFAYELYYLNPDRDVMEIMMLEDVDEDRAMEIFTEEMKKKVIYFVEELVEIRGEVVEIIEHRWL